MSNVINKKDLAEKLAEEFGCSKKDATAYVQFVFDTVADTLKDNGTVDVFGFGKFSISERAARTGINPATKEKIEIAFCAIPATGSTSGFSCCARKAQASPFDIKTALAGRTLPPICRPLAEERRTDERRTIQNLFATERR